MVRLLEFLLDDKRKLSVVGSGSTGRLDAHSISPSRSVSSWTVSSASNESAHDYEHKE